MTGKARDFTPHIRAAGFQQEKIGTVGGCMKIYPVDDAIETVMHEGGLKRVEPEHRRQRMRNWRHTGTFQESRSALASPTPTRYQTLLNDLRETTLGSYWNLEIGKCRDPVGAFPPGMDVANTVFGKKSVSDTPVKDLVNPPKTRFEILCEINEFHPMYRKSHNDYYPGEQIKRNYLEPSFDPTKKYGIRYHYDPTGPCSKLCFRDKNFEPVLSASKIQSDIKERSQFQVGKCLTPNKNINCVLPDTRFGKKSERPLCGVEELMKPNEEPNIMKKTFYTWMNHLNELRNYHKKSGVDFGEMQNLCLYFDKEHTGWIPMDTLYQILVRMKVSFKHSLIIPLATVFGYMKDNNVRYKEFLNMFRVNCELPTIPNFDEEFDAECHYRTTSQMANKDYLLCDNSKSPSAGVPTVPCNSKKVTDVLESSARIAVNPSIYTNYSLSHVDFWEPRTPEYIRSLFEAVGYEFPDDRFEKLWHIATQFENSNEVCVDTFKYILHENTPPPKPEHSFNEDECKENKPK